MENNERINVRGGINALKVGDKPFVIPRIPPYKPSVVRTTAAMVGADEGKEFSVKTTRESIIVTRIS